MCEYSSKALKSQPCAAYDFPAFMSSTVRCCRSRFAASGVLHLGFQLRGWVAISQDLGLSVAGLEKFERFQKYK